MFNIIRVNWELSYLDFDYRQNKGEKELLSTKLALKLLQVQNKKNC